MPLSHRHLITLYKNKRHYGTLEHADFESKLHHPSCGDSLVFYGIVQNTMFEKLSFTGQGCMISQVSASVLIDLLLQKDVHTVFTVTSTDLQHLLHIELGPLRVQCAQLALDALTQAVQTFLAQRKESQDVRQSQSAPSTHPHPTQDSSLF